ncbi:protein yellow-like [Agrilus planipennis]|uniref:Protein yellow-like n=1 Tax=Agrilus planipennis TaxID=224129 RepID=A0A7F5R2G9_AGRPL|nr:protein yellow-like [Agrilus planipennis]
MTRSTEAFIGSKWLCIILVIYASTWTLSESIPNSNAAKISEVFRWKYIEFDYPSKSERQEAIDNGDFIPGRSLLIDVDVYYGSRGQKVFIGMPRMQGGHPATIATVTNKTTADGNPIVKPYPSWDWHKNLNDCPTNRIVSVFRVKVDECGRLWILDTGSRNDSYICPAQILAFDLKTDTLLYRYEIPSNQYEPRSVFVVPVVDVRDKQCKDTIVYVSDCQGFAIIVYNPSLGVSWKVGDKTMYPYPSSGTYEIQGKNTAILFEC